MRRGNGWRWNGRGLRLQLTPTLYRTDFKTRIGLGKGRSGSTHSMICVYFLEFDSSGNFLRGTSRSFDILTQIKAFSVLYMHIYMIRSFGFKNSYHLEIAGIL